MLHFSLVLNVPAIVLNEVASVLLNFKCRTAFLDMTELLAPLSSSVFSVTYESCSRLFFNSQNTMGTVI